MKHLFTVHSPITFLAAHMVVVNMKLDLEDVIILTNRYKVPIDKYSVYQFSSNIENGWFKKLTRLNVTNRLDKYLSGLSNGDEFIAYVDLMSYHQKVLITHPKCMGFNFIEEGNSSYRDKDNLDDLTWDKRNQSYRIRKGFSSLQDIYKSLKWSVRGYNPRLLSVPYSYTSYRDFENVRFFCFSELAYPTISSEKKVVLNISSSDEIIKLAGNISLKDSFVWVDGSNSRFTGLPEEVYHRAIDKAIDKFGNTLFEKPVFVKLRPGLEDYQSNYLYSKLQSVGVSVQVLPNNLILECVFINSVDCIVVGNLSSALFYAQIFGHKAYSLYALFEQRVPTYFDHLPGYWDVVETL